MPIPKGRDGTAAGLLRASRRRTDPFSAPSNFALFLKTATGEPLTPEEQSEWEAYEVALAEAERRRDLLGVTDLGEVIRYGVTTPVMLTELIVDAEFAYWYGAKESTKTWFAMWDALQLMIQGKTVVWVDKEMGEKNLAHRFKVLAIAVAAQQGLDYTDEAAVEEAVATIVDEHLVYCEYPTLDLSQESRAAWELLLKTREPVLLVCDAQTELLADADLNENSGTDVEKWIKGYVTPARRRGVAVVMIDHTGLSEQGRAVGSRHKGAAAKIELHFAAIVKPTSSRVGTVVVTAKKNTMNAPLFGVLDLEQQTYRLGGTPFVLEPLRTKDFGSLIAGAEEANTQASRMRIRTKIMLDCAENPGLNRTPLLQGVSGSTAYKNEEYAWLVEAKYIERRATERKNVFEHHPTEPGLNWLQELGLRTPDSPSKLGGSRDSSEGDRGENYGVVQRSSNKET